MLGGIVSTLHFLSQILIDRGADLGDLAKIQLSVEVHCNHPKKEAMVPSLGAMFGNI